MKGSLSSGNQGTELPVTEWGRTQSLSKAPHRLSAHGSGPRGLPQGITHSSCRPGLQSPTSGPLPRQWAPAALGHPGCPGHCLGTAAPAGHSWPMGSRAGSSLL